MTIPTIKESFIYNSYIENPKMRRLVRHLMKNPTENADTSQSLIKILHNLSLTKSRLCLLPVLIHNIRVLCSKTYRRDFVQTINKINKVASAIIEGVRTSSIVAWTVIDNKDVTEKNLSKEIRILSLLINYIGKQKKIKATKKGLIANIIDLFRHVHDDREKHRISYEKARDDLESEFVYIESLDPQQEKLERIAKIKVLRSQKEQLNNEIEKAKRPLNVLESQIETIIKLAFSNSKIMQTAVQLKKALSKCREVKSGKLSISNPT